MGELLITLLFITGLVLGVYWYAGYSTRSGFAIDENKNFIPDAWEQKFNWFFKSRNIIVLLLGVLIGYLLGNIAPF